MDLKATILIVDDDPNNVDVLSQELAEEGYTTLTAFDGEEALIKVRDHEPDLILLDVMMPKVDGFTVCFPRMKCDEREDNWWLRIVLPFYQVSIYCGSPYVT